MNQKIQSLFNTFGYALFRKDTVANYRSENERLRSEIEALISENENLTRLPLIADYLNQTKSVFGKALMPIDGSIKAVTSIPTDSDLFGKISEGIFAAEVDLVKKYIKTIRDHRVEGDVVEFGIFTGGWMERLYQAMENAKLDRTLWGFDSFEGLSEPSADHDDPYWKKGMFSAGFEEVSNRLKVKERENIKLVPGWFSESLGQEAAQGIKSISYARIDCDIYEPTVQCLEYLATRLSHGSYLVFDDWSYDPRHGETRAFFEWVTKVPELQFEFLFFGMWDHFYIRVWHKGKERF